ncbi:hypothetical protein D9M71_660950 [compost metagenome]
MNGRAGAADVVQRLFGLFPQVEAIGAAVVRIGAAFHQAGLFQLVQQAGEGDRLDLQQVGQLHLSATFVARDLGQGAGLAEGEVAAGDVALEGPAHQAGNVAEEKAEAIFEGGHTEGSI